MGARERGRRDRRTEWPPRDPSRYSESDHFGEAFEDDMRFIERDMVPEVITDGRDYHDEGGEGKMRRKLEYDGVDAVLVLAKDYPLLVTAWTEVNSWAGALASDRWALEDLETIAAFEDERHKQ